MDGLTVIEGKTVEAILSKVRAHRQKHTLAGAEITNIAHPRIPAKIREATLSDFEAVAKLKRRNGSAVDPIGNWQRLWVDNPALKYIRNAPVGWVLETREDIVGSLANIPFTYRYGDKIFTAVTGAGLVVDPEYRAMSLGLASAFHRQKGIDIQLATASVDHVEKLAVAFRSVRLPQPELDERLFWILRPYPFMQAAAKQLDISPPFSALCGGLGWLAVQSGKLLRRRSASQCAADLDVSEIGITQINEEFDLFWTNKLQERPRLYADRGADALRWRFQIRGTAIRILCCRRRDALVGYAVIRNDLDRPDGLRQCRIVDLLARHDDAEIIRALLIATFDLAERYDIHFLDVIGFPKVVRDVFKQANPYIGKLPVYPFYFRASDPDLTRELSASADWYASAYDGQR